ncbi:LOW QUALITY PROTEIN: ribonuclease P protein subunit p25-like protein [Drosophila tropicalis]|uniref:LOW QUALITY PROTEIN: ribonuclease P protein subunit p25-like protein n=1 Tax=Drosophila tropicalis TaxID=46794 RepID=UPI0035AC179B
MMHYSKSENLEQELTKDDLPFHDCIPKNSKDFLWMQVKGGTKVRNVVEYVHSSLNKGEYRMLVWSGSGGGVVKTISCAEILKQRQPLYQVTRMSYTNVEEYWKPQMNGLEEIIVKRRIPAIHILMSIDKLNKNIEGFQDSSTSTDFWRDNQKQQPKNHSATALSASKNLSIVDKAHPH